MRNRTKRRMFLFNSKRAAASRADKRGRRKWRLASAYAKFSGERRVWQRRLGPGASHLISGLYDARLDHKPVLAVVSQQSRDGIGGHYSRKSSW